MSGDSCQGGCDNCLGEVTCDHCDCNGVCRCEAVITTAAEKWISPNPDDIEIDHDARVVRVEVGYWVQAWVFVDNSDMEDCDGDDC